MLLTGRSEYIFAGRKEFILWRWEPKKDQKREIDKWTDAAKIIQQKQGWKGPENKKTDERTEQNWFW